MKKLSKIKKFFNISTSLSSTTDDSESTESTELSKSTESIESIESNKNTKLVNKLEHMDYNLKRYYFPPKSGVDFNKIQVTTEGVYSISSNQGSSLLVSLIEKYFKSANITVTDGTGNNGSDTIALGLKFSHVNSIELDPINFSVLKKNVGVYGLKNVSLYNGDTTKLLGELTQDVIYIDAPWGGSNYKDHPRLLLYLGDMELSDIYNKYKSRAKVFVYKIPSNYDFTIFIQKTKVPKYYLHSFINKKNILKYFLLFVPCE